MIDKLYWHTKPWNQGQIVEISEPQIPGAAEGNGGPGDGLTLRFDHSDWEWSVTDATLGEILRGNGRDPWTPSVRKAIEAREALKRSRPASTPAS